jgi:hypothetical protein
MHGSILVCALESLSSEINVIESKSQVERACALSLLHQPRAPSKDGHVAAKQKTMGHRQALLQYQWLLLSAST